MSNEATPPAAPAAPAGHAAPRAPVARAREIAQRIDTLPLLPSVLVRMLSLDPEGDEYFDRVVEAAGQEPNLAVRLLRYANSAASAPVQPIQTIYQAAMRLGTQECAHMITALSVARVFVPHTPAQRELWRHSLYVAGLARSLAARRGGTREARERAYVAGLLHDIGRFAMFESATDDLERVSEAGWATPEELLATETRLLGYDHAQVGTLVLERWGLPALLVSVVRLHHQRLLPPEACTGALGECLWLVRLADYVAVALEVQPELAGLPADELERAIEPACLRAELGQDPATRSYLAGRIPAIVHEAELAMEQLLGHEAARLDLPGRGG